ncbi:A-kinase anchor protein 17B-like [Pelodytes ibericus]
MAVTMVHDDSEAVELSTTHRLYLKPKAKLLITVILPEDKDPCRPVSNWEIIEQLKNLVDPDHFSFIKVIKNTKGFIRVEGEADTNQLARIFLAKLNGQKLQISSFDDPLSVEVTESPSDFPSTQELQTLLKEAEKDQEELLGNDLAPPCIHVEGLPCKWFSTWGPNGEKLSEHILKSAFEKYGTLSHIDIPMLDPYREEAVGVSTPLNPGSLLTFDAFMLYEDKASCVKAVQSVQGMKLMFTSEDGKSLSCDIKLTLDTTNHFSEEAITRRNAERLKLQHLEQQRKQEKQEEEAERKRKVLEKKYRARKKRAKLKRKLQKQKECEETNVEETEICSAEAMEDTQEWEDRKLLLAQRRVESIKLLTLLMEKVTDLVQFKRHNEEPMDCDVTEDCSEYSISSYLEKSSSPTEEDGSQHETEIKVETGSDISETYLPKFHKSQRKSKRKLFESTEYLEYDFDQCNSQEGVDDLEDTEVQYFDRRIFKLSRKVLNNSYQRLKVYETDEFINYLLNYYDCPEYARLFLETSDSVNKSWCERVVHCNGNGFKIKLQNTNGQAADMKYTPEPNQLKENKCTRNTIIPESSKDSQGTPNHRRVPKQCKTRMVERKFNDSLVSKRSRWTKDCEENYPRSSNNGEETQSSGSINELKDVLEEISSTSEYFSEEVTGTIGRPVKVRKIPRKQRNISQVKKVKPYCISDRDRICCHKDLLGHFLHSYSLCKSLKKHSKCKTTRACGKNYYPMYDTETSELDTEMDTQNRLQWKRKRRMKKKMHTRCSMEEKSHFKDSSLTETSFSDSWSTQHKERVKPMPKRDGLNDAHVWNSKRHSNQWDYYCPEDETSSLEEEEESSLSSEQDEATSFEQDESSLDNEKTHKSCSLQDSHHRQETAYRGIRGKGSFNDYLDWEQHFYLGKIC